MAQQLAANTKSNKLQLVRAASAPKNSINFTAAQQKVINHRGTPFLVTGPAGSGKSETLIAAISARIDEGCDPNSILAITYGRESASKLRDLIATANTLTNGNGATFIANTILEISGTGSQLNVRTSASINTLYANTANITTGNVVTLSFSTSSGNTITVFDANVTNAANIGVITGGGAQQIIDQAVAFSIALG